MAISAIARSASDHTSVSLDMAPNTIDPSVTSFSMLIAQRRPPRKNRLASAIT